MEYCVNLLVSVPIEAVKDATVEELIYQAEKMRTEKGREEVEYFLQCAARDYAGESFEDDYFATTLDV